MNITETLKTAADLALKYKEMDLYEQIVSLREQILALREQNVSLREEITAIRQTIEISSQLVRDGNSYFKTSDAERKHPYCLACWDYEHKLVSLTTRNSSRGKILRCAICDSRKPPKHT